MYVDFAKFGLKLSRLAYWDRWLKNLHGNISFGNQEGLVCMLEFEKVLNLQYQIYVDFDKFGLNSRLAYWDCSLQKLFFLETEKNVGLTPFHASHPRC